LQRDGYKTGFGCVDEMMLSCKGAGSAEEVKWQRQLGDKARQINKAHHVQPGISKSPERSVQWHIGGR
jgi:hypothetical protein